MAKIAEAEIDLNKVNQDRVISKNGGRYLKIIIHVNDTPNNKGNDVNIAEKITKDEINGGTKPKYLGEGKVFHSS
jgi:hypothetical protein